MIPFQHASGPAEFHSTPGSGRAPRRGEYKGNTRCDSPEFRMDYRGATNAPQSWPAAPTDRDVAPNMVHPVPMYPRQPSPMVSSQNMAPNMAYQLQYPGDLTYMSTPQPRSMEPFDQDMAPNTIPDGPMSARQPSPMVSFGQDMVMAPNMIYQPQYPSGPTCTPQPWPVEPTNRGMAPNIVSDGPMYTRRPLPTPVSFGQNMASDMAYHPQHQNGPMYAPQPRPAETFHRNMAPNMIPDVHNGSRYPRQPSPMVSFRQNTAPPPPPLSHSEYSFQPIVPQPPRISDYEGVSPRGEVLQLGYRHVTNVEPSEDASLRFQEDLEVFSSLGLKDWRVAEFTMMHRDYCLEVSQKNALAPKRLPPPPPPQEVEPPQTAGP